MIHPRIESTRVRRRRGKKIWLLPIFLIAAGFLTYRYGGDIWFSLKQRFLPQNLQLLASRSSHVLDSLSARRIPSGEAFAPGYGEPTDREGIAEYIRDSKRILAFYEGSGENAEAIYAYGAMFHFYELLLYTHIDTPSLLALAGRSYLPSADAKKPEEIREIARRTSILARKSLAIDPENAQAPVLYLAQIYGDLLQTERTDPNLADLLKRIEPARLPEALLPAWSWAALALNATRGDPAGLTASMSEKGLGEGIKPVRPDTASADLLRVYACYHARDFIQALGLSRKLQSDLTLSAAIRSEGARMTGEVFKIQGGPALGLPYLLEAKRILDAKDPFLEERIRDWQAGKP